jgi:4-amino-4-deoxy-L-arabinose transferase-like glycosyltransferase
MRLFKLFRSPYLLAAVALTLRLSLAAHLPDFLSAGGNPFRGNEPTHIAMHIARGEGFSSPYDGIPVMPTAQQPPIYPILLAAIFKLFGVYSRAALLAILFINALAGAGAALLTCYVGRSFFPESAAWIAAWFWAVVPTIAATDLFIAHYTLSTFLVLGWLLVMPRMGDSRRDWILLGVASGLAGLLNPMLLLVIPASSVWLRSRKKQITLMMLALVVTVTPWVLRNYLVLGHVYPALRDNFGLELYIGNHPGMEGANHHRCPWTLCDATYDYQHADVPTGNHRLGEMGEPAFMAEKQAQAIAYIRSAPGKFLSRTARRIGAFWLLPYPWFYVVICGLSIFGILRTPVALRTFIIFLFLVYPIAFYITQTSWASSYRHPIEPLLLLTAAHELGAGIVHLLRKSSGLLSSKTQSYSASKVSG